MGIRNNLQKKEKIFKKIPTLIKKKIMNRHFSFFFANCY